MSEEEPTNPPVRRVVLHPRTAAARQHGRRSTLGRRTRGFTVDDVEVRELVGRQRRLALRTLVLLLLIVFGLPTIMILIPGVTDLESYGLPPLHWLATGIGLYVLLVLMGRWHERAANAVDDEWADARGDL